MPADFRAKLEPAADAPNTALTNRETNKATRSGATAGITSEATRGRQAANVLDALVEPQLSGNTSLLSQWKSAERLGGEAAPVANTSLHATAKRPSAATTGTTPVSTTTGANEGATAVTTAGTTMLEEIRHLWTDE